MSLHYIIDGYNFIRHPLFNPPRKIRDARIGLMSLIKKEKLGGSLRNEITVVFDGYPEANFIEKTDGNISVLYSGSITADEKIKKIVENSRNPKVIVVISDDREIQFSSRAAGARALGIAEFLNKKEPTSGRRRNGSADIDLNYSQMEAINDELKRIWLKEKEK